MKLPVGNDEIWNAVAEPSRRSILELLVNRGEASASSLAESVAFSRQAVAKNLAILEHAQLVQSRKLGREVLFSVRPDELERAAQLLVNTGTAWDRRLQSIKRIAEETHRAVNEPGDVFFG
ncbi:MAG: metalloregulator ArsR/SmtB family transcription factor [Acidimicrobiales bacterium]